ncbi:MAG: hypothetical protein IPJ64_09210 [Saprospiraceae bacterium]|nr:hypothetical protein [Saprospiraceae bacterium]MBK7796531.1 hypothetical protein [Saprospiraceae bacterium]
MRKINQALSAILAFTSFLSVTRAELKPMIDKEQLKKEKQDLKEFKKLAKEFNSAIKSSNLDYQNVIWQRVRVYIDKEIKETSSRVGTMQKSNLIRPNKMNAQDSVEMADLPQGYNPHVNGQIKNLSKEEIEKAKKQNEKIGDFVELSKKQKSLLQQISQLKEINSTTTSGVLQEAKSQIQKFLMLMKDELVLLKKLA